MNIGILGLAKAGKTTVFNALTGHNALVDKYIQAHLEAHIGVVQVLDERVSRLSELYQPKKTIYAQFEFYDFPALFLHKSEDVQSAKLISEVKTMEGYAIVLRAFEDEEMDELYGKPDPLRDLANLEDELLLHDMMIAEKRLEKIDLSYKRGVKTPAIQSEEKALHKILSSLHANQPIRSASLGEDEARAIRGFQFLTGKPRLVILNCDESGMDAYSGVLEQLAGEGNLVATLAGKFEYELLNLDSSDAAAFRAELGISESARDRIIHLCYQLMGYISFFTVGEDEVRAWTINRGDNALTAASKIHSDLARGFIRAECFQYADLINHGSEKTLREKGLFKLEGKDYLVKDGDIISIRFNV